MKKALMYASVASMIEQFNMDNIKILQELGYKVDVACNFEKGSTISQEKIENLRIQLSKQNVTCYHIPIPRSLTNITNLKKSYKITKALLNKESYDLIHCHSPIGGVICRIANKHSMHYELSRMIYTAHGFHFFRGNSPIKNFIFRNIEKHCAKYTDTLITINKEDFEAAKKFRLKKDGQVKYIPGVGIDIEKISSIKGSKIELCKELKIPNKTTLLLSVGELNDNKNHKVVIEALKELPENIHYIICGNGPLKERYGKLATELNVSQRLHLLGYRTDVIRIMKSCDVFVFPSKREGLGLAAIEAMACGLPLITSDRHGILDYAENRINSVVCNPYDYKDFLNAIKTMDEAIKKKFGIINLDKSKNYDIKKIDSKMRIIYMENK